MKRILTVLLALAMALACGPMTFAENEEEPYSFKLYTNWGKLGPVGEMYMDNLEKELNLDIEYIFPATSGYNDNVVVTLASDDLPDVMLMPSETSSVFREACQNGLFQDISAYLATGDYPDLLEHIADTAWDSMDIFQDGRVWGVPRGSMMRADGYEIRKDWLDKVGIELTEGEPITLDQMYEILYAFTYDDPDGNGVNDTYGFCASSSEFCMLFSEAFGISRSLGSVDITNDGWGVYDGEYGCLKYSKTDSSYKDYLTFLNKLWTDGLYDPDTFNISTSTASQRFIDGVTGMETSFAGNMNRKIASLKAVNENADLIFIPAVVKNEGDPYTAIVTGTGVWYVYTFTKACEHPERILELMNTAIDDDHWMDLACRGIKGITYDIDENGNVVDLSSQIPAEYKGNNGVMAIIRFMRRSDGIEFFLDVDLSPENRERYLNLINIQLDNYIPSLHGNYVPPTADDITFMEYCDTMSDSVAQIITGVKPVDDWDNILEGWYAAGGEKYTAEMVEYITSVYGAPEA